MSQRQTWTIERSLSSPFVLEIPEHIASFAVEKFDGTDGTVFLQKSRDNSDPDAIEITRRKAQSVPYAEKRFLVNNMAQAGKSIKLSVGIAGTSISPGSEASEAGANVANQETLIAELGNHPAVVAGQKAVAAAAAALGSGAIPDGMAVCISAPGNNADGNANTLPVFVGPSGVTIANGYRLEPGSSISLRVDDLSDVYVIAADANQTVSYIVEVAS